MTTQQLVPRNGAVAPSESNDLGAILEQVVITGDLEKLTAAERVVYYRGLCQSLGLNPLTRPFEYLKLSNKLTLYPNKNAAEQIRRQAGVSIVSVDDRMEGELYIVKTRARIGDREDIDLGAVSIKNLAGEALGNALKKAVTQSKRRVTFSLCGLGMLDETEIETIPDAVRVSVDADGVIQDAPDPTRPQPRMNQAAALMAPDPQAALKRFWARAVELGYVNAEGKLKKSAVHAAFGVAAVDGALEQYRQARGATWAELTADLERITADRAVAEADPDALPFDPPAERCPRCGSETIDGECGACGMHVDAAQGQLLDAPPARTPAHAARGSH